MNNSLLTKTLFSLLLAYSAPGFTQPHRDSVSKEEVDGTFVMQLPTPYQDNSNTLTVRALGNGKLNIYFNLVYHYKVNGELQANSGELSGIANIKGDTAIYSSTEFGKCTITITFVKPGMLTVKQEGADFDCGFGHNIYADGTYYKKQK